MNCFSATILAAFSAATAASEASAQKPHVLLVLADDYAHGSLGVHRRDAQGPSADQARAEVITPVLDGLLDQGVHLTNHYAFKICGPSRSSMQSGRLAVHVNAMNTGPLVHNKHDPISGYAGIPRNMTGMAEKMRSGGYRTHMVGKWDAGMATPEHTPQGRGYETWLGYYQHANHYWRKKTSLQATGEFDQCADSMVDFSWLNETYHGGVTDLASLSDACQNDHESDPSCYEEHIFKVRGLEIINSHNPSEPLFLFYAFHLMHTPLQVPLAYLDRVDQLVTDAGANPIDTDGRRLISAMALYMDDTVGELVQAMKDRGMWENTLFVFLADNGGPMYEPGGASNYPLKGGKYNDFQGGVRTNAFMSGGFIPEDKRGTVFSGIISIADWYGTFSEMAGVDVTDEKSEAANAWLTAQGLPTLQPIDSVPQWGFVTSNTNGRPGPLHLSDGAVLQWPYKLVTGVQPYGRHSGELFPNCSTVKGVYADHGPQFVDLKIFDHKLDLARRTKKEQEIYWQEDCGEGCLYNLEVDPNEHTNLAAVEVDTFEELKNSLAMLNKDLFLPERGDASTAACKTALHQGGFMGPFVDAEGWYSPAPHRSPMQKLDDARRSLEYSITGNSLVKRTVEGVVQAVVPLGREVFMGTIGRATQFVDTCRQTDLLV